MAVRECAIEIAGKTGMSVDKAKKLVEDLEKGLPADRGSDAYDKALVQARYEKESWYAAQILRDKRDAVINTTMKANNDARMAKLTSQGLSKFKALVSIFGGTINAAEGSRASVGLAQITNHAKFVSGLTANLEKENLLKIFSDPNMQVDHATYLEYLNTKGKDGITEPKVSAQSKRIATLVKDQLDRINTDMNRSGGFIGELDKFAGSVTHNAKAVIKAGFDKWFGDISQHIDRDALFRNLSNQLQMIGDLAPADAKLMDFRANTNENYEQVMRFIHNRITEGDHYFDITSSDLGNKVSASRLLPFKDAAGYVAYNKDYGEGSWSESIGHSLEIKSRQLSLLEQLGTNPRKEFNRLLNDEATGKLSRGEARTVQNVYGNVDGSLNNPMNPTLAEVGNAIRVWNGTTGLGKALFAHLATDNLTRFIEQKRIGVGTMQAMANQVKEIFHFVTGGTFESDAERQMITTGYGIGVEGLNGRILNTSADGIPGFGTKMMRLELKLNGEQYWIDRGKRTSAAIMSGMIGSLKDMKFEEIPSTMRTMMGRYTIDAQKWDIMRGAATKMEDGRYHIMPDAIEDIDDEKFQAMHPDLSDRQMRQTRKALADTVRGFVIDRSSYFANMSPDAVDRAIALQGTNPGTYLGMGMRILSQFKQFPISATRKIWGEAGRGGGDTTDWNQVAQIIAGSFVTGYGAYASRSVLEGKEPAMNGEAAAEAWSKASGGIYGDLLMQSIRSMGTGEGIVTSLLGPTAGKVDEVSKIASKAYKTGTIDNGEYKQLMGMVPYNNVFWLRPMLDYTILNNLQERLRPGYLSRMRNQMQKYGQQPIMSGPVSISNKTIQGDSQ